MIAPASFIGFAVAALLATWAGSTLLGGIAWLGRRATAKAGPAVERAAAAIVLVGAPVIGASVLLALVGHSLVSAASGDHCSVHGHHPHLCLFHGGSWAAQPWAVVTVAMFGAYLAVRLTQGAMAVVGSHLATRRLARVSQATSEGALVAPADDAFCFVAGLLSPRIFVSARAWAALDSEERRGMLAHERAHVVQQDLLWRGGLGALALLGAPCVAPRMLRHWRQATERLCDARAAEQVGADSVAQALVKMTRLGTHRGDASPGLAFGGRSGLEDRVEALLAGAPTGARLSRRLVGLATSLLTLCGLAIVGFADPLHHALETILGAL